jgi:hypothetical protein
MAGGGGFAAAAERGHARDDDGYGGRGGVTVPVVVTCLMAASCGLIFGYDIGVSGARSATCRLSCLGLVSLAVAVLVKHACCGAFVVSARQSRSSEKLGTRSGGCDLAFGLWMPACVAVAPSPPEPPDAIFFLSFSIFPLAI